MSKPKLANDYERKTAAETRDCFICRKDTSTVLRNDADFFFVCQTHLSDVVFCTPIKGPEEVGGKNTASKDVDKTKAAGKTEPGKEKKADPIPQQQRYKLSSAYFRMREERLARLQSRKAATSSTILAKLPSVPTSPPKRP